MDGEVNPINKFEYLTIQNFLLLHQFFSTKRDAIHIKIKQK
jgi:hypothetical protein